MIGQMAIAIAFSGFNNLGRMVTPVFDGSYFLPIFCLLQKNEENLSTTS